MVDFSGAQRDPETGLLCVTRDDFVSTLKKDSVLRCDHKQVRQCHFTYITKFSSQQERVCDENFEKICQIVFRQQAVNETVKKCYKPLEIVCDEQRSGGPEYPLPSYSFSQDNSIDGSFSSGQDKDEEICETFYESACTTRYQKSGPGGKLVGDTRCKKVPRRLCGRPSCLAVEGAEECHDTVVALLNDVPEETCDLNPQQVCRLETRLVPHLEPVEECRYQPRQVCQVGFSAPRPDRRPLKVKLCLREGESLATASAAPGSYGAPPSPSEPYYKPVNMPEIIAKPVSKSYSTSAFNQV